MKRIMSAAILVSAFCLAVFSQAKENQCPEIRFVSPNKMLTAGKSTIFEVKVGEVTENFDLSYEWTFSKGKIIRGQGTSQVELLINKEVEGVIVEVSVKVIGLPKDCVSIYSDIYSIESPLITEPVDTFGKLRDSKEYQYRIDNFIIAINQVPSSEGLILALFDKKDSRSYKISVLNKMYKALIFRKYDLTRITFAVSEGNYQERISLWIIPPGEDYPTNAPDVDETVIKAEEFKQKINALFPKK